MKCATSMGAMNPAVVPRKFITPYRVATKFGARSCALTRFVMVEAPLTPRQATISDTHTNGSCPMYGSAIRMAPGMRWAGEVEV